MKEYGVPLVVTYNTNFKNLSFLIRKNLQFLYVHPETKIVFGQHLLSPSEVLRIYQDS